MLIRLANVIYWLGSGVAALFVLGALAYFVFLARSAEELTPGVIMLLFAGASWLSGRAVRYILAGI